MRQRSEIIDIGISSGCAKSPEALALEAIERALKHSGLDFTDIDCFIFCENIAAGETQTGADFLTEISSYDNFRKKSVYKTAKDGLYGLYAANSYIVSGECDLVIVVGIGAAARQGAFKYNKFEDLNPDEFEKKSPFLMPSLEMNKYLATSGAGKAECAEIVSLSKEKALKNIRANFGLKISKSKILSQEPLIEPLCAMDIAPSVENAAALVLSSRNLINAPDKVFIDAACWVYDKPQAVLRDEEIGYPKHLDETAGIIYKLAGVENPLSEIDLFELEDSYSYQLLQSVKAVTLRFEESSFEVFMRENEKINLSGGCLGMGNPAQAKGLMRLAEAFFQLRGVSGANQAALTRGKILIETHGALPDRSAGAVVLSVK